ncbi:MAG: cytochrome b N-terminal domain-containing protein, partial [Pirellulaceae bacterium]|nr:cytochrome b N-terminal domain-containing protein [Pirellulaceae bacterium]
MSALVKRFGDWLDHRTGYRDLVHESLYENVPGGARWRYVSGSMLVFAFVTQAVTGIFLWMSYSPGSNNAWESVYYIQNEMAGGWLLRGIHHFMAQAMVVLLPVHLLQVVLDKAYKAPREMNYWMGLVLMLIVLALGLTGYLLPWDQKGYWATKVATNLMSLPPGGEYVQKLVVGGQDYGHFTLTRFFALHAGVLPALLVIFLAMHIALFRRHGITAESSPRRPDQYFWPHQVFKDAVACLALMAVVLLAVLHWNPISVLAGKVPIHALGAELSAPADPSELYSAARPEWYFLFLFQLLKKFEDEFIGAIVVPGLVFGYLCLMPLIGRFRIGHWVNVVVLLGLLGGAVYLTFEAMQEDNYARWYTYDPNKFPDDAEAKKKYDERFQASREFLEAVEQGHHDYDRVRDLVGYYGIPRSGAITLQREDPETQGPRLFARNCASCHPYLDAEGQGIAASEVSAPNLYGFGTSAWFMKFLSTDPEQGIASDHVFGKTAHAEGEMAGFVQDTFGEADDDVKAQRDDLIALLVAEADVPAEREAIVKAQADGTLERGREALVNFGCTDCHKFHDQGELGSYPDLTGYGGVQWLKEFIANPSGERFYPESNDRMPAFAEHPDPLKNQMTDQQLELLARWLRGDARQLQPPSPPADAP